jgi:hypothetical protein
VLVGTNYPAEKKVEFGTESSDWWLKADAYDSKKRLTWAAENGVPLLVTMQCPLIGGLRTQDHFASASCHF